MTGFSKSPTGRSVVRLSDRRARRRRAVNDAPLPELSPIVVEAVRNLLMAEQGMLKPPEKTAALLALIVELHRGKRPFPSRQVVADALKCSIFTIDAALSQRTADGYIELELQVKPGDVAARNSVVKERHYHPSEQLQRVVANARRRA